MTAQAMVLLKKERILLEGKPPPWMQPWKIFHLYQVPILHSLQLIMNQNKWTIHMKTQDLLSLELYGRKSEFRKHRFYNRISRLQLMPFSGWIQGHWAQKQQTKSYTIKGELGTSSTEISPQFSNQVLASLYNCSCSWCCLLWQIVSCHVILLNQKMQDGLTCHPHSQGQETL